VLSSANLFFIDFARLFNFFHLSIIVDGIVNDYPCTSKHASAKII